MKIDSAINIFGLQKWITPVLKQSFVTIGVSLNSVAFGIILGFTVVLLEQLAAPGSKILIDDEQGSWIASLPGFFAFGGTFLATAIMSKFGRRKANLISITILIISWISIIFATNIAVLLTARSLQGLNLGMGTVMASILIGEYTSPKNRGAFLMTISFCIGIGVLLAHVIASFMSWKIGALVCLIIAVVDLVIVFLSPESPSWLASKGRFEESREVFRWLRGDKEEQELDKIIDACVFNRNLKASEVSESFCTRIETILKDFRDVLTKKEFYKPLIILSHLYMIQTWCGVNILVGFPKDYIQKTSGLDVNVPLISTSIDIQRIASSLFATCMIKKFRRRLMILVTVSFNIVTLIALAAYSYAKEHYTLPFDHPLIGVLLSHCMMFSIATGSLPFPFTIAGEILPLEHRGLAGGISTLIFSIHVFLVFKFIPFCFTHFGVYGTLSMNAAILAYGLIVVLVLIPETKDKTLQDIEDEFRKKPLQKL